MFFGADLTPLLGGINASSKSGVIHHSYDLAAPAAPPLAEFGMDHLTTAGEDASGISTTGVPLPSAGTTQTSDVVASGPGRDIP
jgi:hypothetical protein